MSKIMTLRASQGHLEVTDDLEGLKIVVDPKVGRPCFSRYPEQDLEEESGRKELPPKVGSPHLTLNGAQVQHVTELDVSDNGITSLEVTSLSSLTSLRCSNNAIVSIALHGAALLSFVAHRNRVTSIRVKSHPRRLQYFDISRNCLGSVPPWLVSCNQLEYLDVSSNGVASLPAYVTSGHLACLRDLRANHNTLKTLSSTECLAEDSLSAFERRRSSPLQRLSLHHNRIHRLARNFLYAFSRLRVLNLSSNRLTQLPESVNGIQDGADQDGADSCPSLQELYIAENELENLVPVEACSGLKILHAPFNNITSLSQSFCWSCEKVEELVLSGNKLSFLPSAISRLSRLKVLKVHLNPIQELPKLSHLSHLKVIDASHCRLGKVDFESLVGNSLTSLDIAFNPSLVVDRHQFSKCKSARAVNVVNTANEKDRSLPFHESKAPGGHRNNYSSQFHTKGVTKTSLTEHSKQQNAEGTETTPWKIGFCEAIGYGTSKLSVAQLRVPDLLQDGRVSLVAMADGGENPDSAPNLLTSFPKAFREENMCSPDLNDALKYSVLSCLRKMVVNGGSVPDGFCSAYLEVEWKRNDKFSNVRSSMRSFSADINCCSLRLCCFGEITAIVTTCEGAPLVISSSGHNKLNDGFQSQLKGNSRCDNDKFSHLPDPQTTLIRLSHHHQSLIIGSTILWEHIEPEEANRICLDIRDPAIASKRLLTLAQSYGSKKSLSVLVVYFPRGTSRNTYQYSSLSESKVNNEHKGFNSKTIPVHTNYSSNQERSSNNPQNGKYFFSEVNVKRANDTDNLARYPPSGQSDNEDSTLETSNERKTRVRAYSSPTKNTNQTPKTFKYFDYASSLDANNSNDSEHPREEVNPGRLAMPCDLISPPAGFADSDIESLGSDSGFSGNSDGKIASSSVNQHDRSSDVSQVSEEQYRSWEYVVARNTKFLYQQELNSLKRDQSNRSEDLCSSSSPSLAVEASSECSTTEVNVEAERAAKRSSTPDHHLPFHRNILRKSRFARGAMKLLQSKFNLGSTFKLSSMSKLRYKSTSFKRFGSLQNLKYYKTHRPWSISTPNINQQFWTEKKLSEEMREKNSIDCSELESRMQHYWNTGVTCF